MNNGHMETLELFYNRFVNEWHLRDTRGNHIGTMQARADAEKYATEMGYRLKIHTSGDIRDKAEWFTPPATSRGIVAGKQVYAPHPSALPYRGE